MYSIILDIVDFSWPSAADTSLAYITFFNAFGFKVNTLPNISLDH